MNSNLGISIMDKTILAAVREQIAKIDPIVKAHQGGVEIIKATEDEVVLALKGHCAGCPMAPITYGKILNRYIQEACPNLKNIKYVEMK
ncbi:MAG: NifU family protein [Patescibacteria group bacterium]